MKQVFSLFLTLLMLTTNVGITFATHYCGGKAVKSSVSFTHDELGCGMAVQDEQACEKIPKTDVIKQEKCCKNTFSTFSIEDDFNNSTPVSLTFDDIKLVATFVVSFVHNYFFIHEEAKVFSASTPPLIKQDIAILYQVFLI
jgi:hypothetical protein